MLISPLHDHLDLMLAFRPWDEIAVDGLAVYGDRAHTLLMSVGIDHMDMIERTTEAALHRVFLGC